ncbi:hypothetical protein [[Mycoplasma] gypis]|uniref:Lipoprotein n=1 Tax=[Mycoplasma] gypis TaxID=92404 RepID=A0ABZ2RNZ9_9BACT|nr:hypothetical protein [[Mycoplasma] gypis]MBN0919237.1 hypothetical protein [[Mycoplasma] gypis]
MKIKKSLFLSSAVLIAATTTLFVATSCSTENPDTPATKTEIDTLKKLTSASKTLTTIEVKKDNVTQQALAQELNVIETVLKSEKITNKDILQSAIRLRNALEEYSLNNTNLDNRKEARLNKIKQQIDQTQEVLQNSSSYEFSNLQKSLSDLVKKAQKLSLINSLNELTDVYLRLEFTINNLNSKQQKSINEAQKIQEQIHNQILISQELAESLPTFFSGEKIDIFQAIKTLQKPQKVISYQKNQDDLENLLEKHNIAKLKLDLWNNDFATSSNTFKKDVTKAKILANSLQQQDKNYYASKIEKLVYDFDQNEFDDKETLSEKVVNFLVAFWNLEKEINLRNSQIDSIKQKRDILNQLKTQKINYSLVSRIDNLINSLPLENELNNIEFDQFKNIYTQFVNEYESINEQSQYLEYLNQKLTSLDDNLASKTLSKINILIQNNPDLENLKNQLLTNLDNETNFSETYQEFMSTYFVPYLLQNSKTTKNASFLNDFYYQFKIYQDLYKNDQNLVKKIASTNLDALLNAKNPSWTDVDKNTKKMSEILETIQNKNEQYQTTYQQQVTKTKQTINTILSFKKINNTFKNDVISSLLASLSNVKTNSDLNQYSAFVDKVSDENYLLSFIQDQKNLANSLLEQYQKLFNQYTENNYYNTNTLNVLNIVQELKYSNVLTATKLEKFVENFQKMVFSKQQTFTFYKNRQQTLQQTILNFAEDFKYIENSEQFIENLLNIHFLSHGDARELKADYLSNLETFKTNATNILDLNKSDDDDTALYQQKYLDLAVEMFKQASNLFDYNDEESEEAASQIESWISEDILSYLDSFRVAAIWDGNVSQENYGQKAQKVVNDYQEQLQTFNNKMKQVNLEFQQIIQNNNQEILEKFKKGFEDLNNISTESSLFIAKNIYNKKEKLVKEVKKAIDDFIPTSQEINQNYLTQIIDGYLRQNNLKALSQYIANYTLFINSFGVLVPDFLEESKQELNTLNTQTDNIKNIENIKNLNAKNWVLELQSIALLNPSLNNKASFLENLVNEAIGKEQLKVENINTYEKMIIDFETQFQNQLFTDLHKLGNEQNAKFSNLALAPSVLKISFWEKLNKQRLDGLVKLNSSDEKRISVLEKIKKLREEIYENDIDSWLDYNSYLENNISIQLKQLMNKDETQIIDINDLNQFLINLTNLKTQSLDLQKQYQVFDKQRKQVRLVLNRYYSDVIYKKNVDELSMAYYKYYDSYKETNLLKTSDLQTYSQALKDALDTFNSKISQIDKLVEKHSPIVEELQQKASETNSIANENEDPEIAKWNMSILKDKNSLYAIMSYDDEAFNKEIQRFKDKLAETDKLIRDTVAKKQKIKEKTISLINEINKWVADNIDSREDSEKYLNLKDWINDKTSGSDSWDIVLRQLNYNYQYYQKSFETLKQLFEKRQSLILQNQNLHKEYDKLSDETKNNQDEQIKSKVEEVKQLLNVQIDNLENSAIEVNNNRINLLISQLK